MGFFLWNGWQQSGMVRPLSVENDSISVVALASGVSLSPAAQGRESHFATKNELRYTRTVFVYKQVILCMFIPAVQEHLDFLFNFHFPTGWFRNVYEASDSVSVTRRRVCF